MAKGLNWILHQHVMDLMIWCHQKILKLYYDLGGRIITIGSDSHKSTHFLDTYVGEMKDELRKTNFKEFCIYKQMKPILHKL